MSDSCGQKITDPKADSNVLVAAFAHYLEQVPKPENAPPAAAGSVTVGTLATKYILAIKTSARTNTVKIRQKYLLSFCDSGFQKRPAESITKVDIDDWLNSNKGWGPGSRRMAIQAVRAMFCWGAGVPNEKGLLQISALLYCRAIRFRESRLASQVSESSTSQRSKLAAVPRGFNAARKRAEARGVRFDSGTSIYACRHTFAKRCLNGTFGNKISLVLLAQFMGNSVDVCRENYLNWSDEAITHEWDAIA